MENNKHCEICVLRDTEQCPDKENKNLFCGSFRAAGPYSETLKATTRITGWLAVFMAWLVLGVIASLVIMLACCTDTHGRLIALASVPYVFLGFYVLYAFYQRKPDAVALAKGYLVINCAVYVFGLLIQGVLSLSSSGVSIGLAVNIAWYVYLTCSQKVKEVIPVEYRKTGKVIWIVVGALVVLISVACVWETTVGKRTALRAELLREIEIQNRSCPIDNGIVEITTIKLQGDTVVYYCWVKEDYQGEYLKSVIASPEYKKTLLLGSKDMMQGEDLGYFLRRYGVAMKYVYDFGDDEIDVVLTMDDIKQMANQVPESEEESFFAAMKSSVEMQNAICPTVIDEATVMDSVRMDEESVTSYYTLDEELVDMQLLWENREEMHSAIVDELKVAYAQRITSMYKYKISTKYVYIGNQTQRIVKVVVTPDEYL